VSLFQYVIIIVSIDTVSKLHSDTESSLTATYGSAAVDFLTSWW